MVEELSASNLLENEVEPVRLFKVLDQLDDVLVSLNIKNIINVFFLFIIFECSIVPTHKI